MNIRNYTSTIEASRSMARIEELLVEIGATNLRQIGLIKVIRLTNS